MARSTKSIDIYKELWKALESRAQEKSMSSISWSEVNLGRKCLKAHDYRYNQNLERKKPVVPMLVGKILHEMLDAHTNALRIKDFKGDAWDVLEKYETAFKDFFAEEKEEYGDIPENCSRIFEAYIKRYKNDGLKYEGSEEFVATDLASNLRYIGYIDKVAVDAQNRRWLMDHKFNKNIPGPEDRFHELQLLLYIWAWNRWNPSNQADGICWDFVRTTPPTLPDVLKNGELSQRANIRCDRATYEEEIKRLKLDPKPYQPFLKKLEKNDSMFFERVFLPIPTKKMLDQIVEDFRTSAVMLRMLTGIAPRSMSKFNCKGCEFQKLCEAEIRGLDSNFVKKAHYKKRERHNGEENRKKENF